MVFSVFRQKSFGLCLLLSVTCLLGVGTASAQQVGPGCDPAFMLAMQDKAWMEAQREIMIAQTTIAKPDSVFSLGCYQNFSGAFSVSFGNNPASGSYTSLIQSPINSYLGASFNHNFGGAHSTISRSESNCGAMLSLWNYARGADLDNPSALLHTLRDMSTYNRGSFPSPRAPVGFTGPLNKFFGAKTANQSVGAAFDDMNLFAGVTAPASQLTTAPNNTCARGIPTGVEIAPSRPELVCPNPGCIPNTASPPRCCEYDGTSKCSP
jgi:hypothetical protein